MKKNILYLIVLGGILLLAISLFKYKKSIYNLLIWQKANTIEANPSEPVLAVFSFQEEAPNMILGSFPHFTIRLNDYNHWGINREVIAQIPDSIPLMITIETWGEKIDSKYSRNQLKEVEGGKYDHVIEQLCTQLIGARPNVYFRFNPEMEVPGNSYPWQIYGSYIGAFHHFFALCKTYAPQVKHVWAPAGYPGVMSYYPGDEFVDAASVILKSDSEMLLDAYPKNYPLAYDLMRRLHRLRFISKPIFIIGSKQNANDSLDQQLVSSISHQINKNRNIIYSADNFQRPAVVPVDTSHRKIEIGVYDPKSLLIEEESVNIEHLFVDFGSLHDGAFQKNFGKVVEREHDVFITFEPFRNPNGETDLKVIQNVTQGIYDKEINQLYSIIMSTNRKVYLRYAHEMEIPITRYPWQSQSPWDYIASYRYFMTFQDSLPSTIYRIWGPAGDRGSIEWWPGNDVVDIVSIAIYGLPDKNITDPNKQESFSNIFIRKEKRFRLIDKPLYIAEFGVKGDEEYQTIWLENAAKVIRENPQIIGANYFNMSDTPKAWGEIKPPDWRITKKSFHHFVKVLNE